MTEQQQERAADSDARAKEIADSLDTKGAFLALAYMIEDSRRLSRDEFKSILKKVDQYDQKGVGQDLDLFYDTASIYDNNTDVKRSKKWIDMQAKAIAGSLDREDGKTAVFLLRAEQNNMSIEDYKTLVTTAQKLDKPNVGYDLFYRKPESLPLIGAIASWTGCYERGEHYVGVGTFGFSFKGLPAYGFNGEKVATVKHDEHGNWTRVKELSANDKCQTWR